jgi:hypothetical protein
MLKWGSMPEQVLDSMHFLIGTVNQLVETIVLWRERFGISYITVLGDVLETFAPIVARLKGMWLPDSGDSRRHSPTALRCS